MSGSRAKYGASGNRSKSTGKYQESIQSSATLDPGVIKRQEKITYHRAKRLADHKK